MKRIDRISSGLNEEVKTAQHSHRNIERINNVNEN